MNTLTWHNVPWRHAWAFYRYLINTGDKPSIIFDRHNRIATISIYERTQP